MLLMKCPSTQHSKGATVFLGLLIMIIEMRIIRNTSYNLFITIINMNIKFIIIITIVVREANKCLLVPNKSLERLIGHKADQQDQRNFIDFDQVSGNATPPHLTIMLKVRILASSPRVLPESIGVNCNICSTMNQAPNQTLRT